MLFFKQKNKPDEFLPPPPPFPSMELEEGGNAGSQGQFNVLFDDLDKDMAEISAEMKSSNLKPLKERKPSKRELKELKRGRLRQLKAEKALSKSRGKTPMISEKLDNFPEIDESFGSKDIDLGLKEIENLSDTDITAGALNKFDIDYSDIEKELDKGNEKSSGLDEDEITNAIGKIKHQEKRHLLKRLFSMPKVLHPTNKEEQGSWMQMEAQKMPENHIIPEQMDNISRMQKMINDARGYLANLDVEAAKRSYIEILGIYNSIKPQEQAKVYHDIRELYFERKSAEQLKS